MDYIFLPDDYDDDDDCRNGSVGDTIFIRFHGNKMSAFLNVIQDG